MGDSQSNTDEQDFVELSAAICCSWIMDGVDCCHMFMDLVTAILHLLHQSSYFRCPARALGTHIMIGVLELLPSSSSLYCVQTDTHRHNTNEHASMSNLVLVNWTASLKNDLPQLAVQ